MHIPKPEKDKPTAAVEALQHSSGLRPSFPSTKGLHLPEPLYHGSHWAAPQGFNLGQAVYPTE